MNMNKQTTDKTFLGHPKGLYYLFFAELWERFSFYGMRALLVLYMTKQLLFTDQMSFGIYAAYMSLVYFTPLIGGILADNYLGYRKSIIIGGLFMAFGHFFLSIESSLFYFGSLALIVVGNGFFKPNISTFVGELYEKEDLRRDSGFTIFYMGINIGAAVAPLLCAFLAELYGWHYGFMLAGIGMLIGLYFFHHGAQSGVFEDKGLVPNQQLYDRKILGLNKQGLIVVMSIICVPIFALIIRFYQFEHYLVWLVSFVILAALTSIYRSVEPTVQKRLLVIAYFTSLMTLFWAIFEQAGSSLTLFADRNINLIGINAAQTNSINAGFIILLAIPFSLMWSHLSRKGNNPNSAIKAGIGIFLLGLGFVIFGASANDLDAAARTPMWYLILGYFVLTVGELFISPIGLSKVTELAPPKYLAFLMGIFFTSSFYGHFFAGKIANMTAVVDGDKNLFLNGYCSQITEFITGINISSVSEQNSELLQLLSYTAVYSNFGVLSMIIGVVCILISPLIKTLMCGIE